MFLINLDINYLKFLNYMLNNHLIDNKNKIVINPHHHITQKSMYNLLE